MNEKRNVLRDKTFLFAIEIIKNHKILIEKKEFNSLSQQATELLKIIRSSILTAKGKIRNS